MQCRGWLHIVRQFDSGHLQLVVKCDPGVFLPRQPLHRRAKRLRFRQRGSFCLGQHHPRRGDLHGLGCDGIPFRDLVEDADRCSVTQAGSSLLNDRQRRPSRLAEPMRQAHERFVDGADGFAQHGVELSALVLQPAIISRLAVQFTHGVVRQRQVRCGRERRQRNGRTLRRGQRIVQVVRCWRQQRCRLVQHTIPQSRQDVVGVCQRRVSTRRVTTLGQLHVGTPGVERPQQQAGFTDLQLSRQCDLRDRIVRGLTVRHRALDVIESCDQITAAACLRGHGL